MLNEASIRSFLLLAKEGSYTKTARLQYLSQQAVSKQMTKLEEELGCTLLRREQGKLVLTEAGQVFYDAFSQMGTLLADAKRQVGQMNDSWASRLVIGVLDAMILPETLRETNRRFRQICPDVQLVFKNNAIGLNTWLEEGTIDMAFTLEDDCPASVGCATIPIVTVREILAVCADHPKATEDADYLDFRDEPVLYSPNPAMEQEEQFRKILPPGFPDKHMVPKDDFIASSVAAEQMQGVMFLHEGTRMDENKNFRFYPTGRTNRVVLAYPRTMKKRCARKYINEVRHILTDFEQNDRI